MEAVARARGPRPLRVLNRTHLKLRLVDKTKTEMTEWVKNPQDVVPSGTNFDSTVRNTPQATGHGLFQLDTYAAYAPVDGQDVYAGMFVVMNGIECKTIHLQICLDYSRTQGSWGSTLNPSLFHNASLDVRWIYSDGNPDKYVSEFRSRRGDGPDRTRGTAFLLTWTVRPRSDRLPMDRGAGPSRSRTTRRMS